jgi:hypothetical protein
VFEEVLMSLVRGLCWCLAGLIVLSLAGVARAQAPEAEQPAAAGVPVDPAPTPDEARIYAALDKQMSLEFIDTPLADVASFLHDLHGIPVLLDRGALEAAGVAIDTPVTLSLKDVRLRSALGLLLEELHLTYVVHHEALRITTPAAARAMTDVRVYDVSSILGLGDSADDLARVLTESLAPAVSTPTYAAGPVATPDQVLAELRAADPTEPARSITPFGNMLIVRDTTLGHRELTETLNALQAGAIRSAEALRKAQEEALKAATPMPPPMPMPMPEDEPPPGADQPLRQG